MEDRKDVVEGEYFLQKVRDGELAVKMEKISDKIFGKERLIKQKKVRMLVGGTERRWISWFFFYCLQLFLIMINDSYIHIIIKKTFG